MKDISGLKTGGDSRGLVQLEGIHAGLHDRPCTLSDGRAGGDRLLHHSGEYDSGTRVWGLRVVCAPLALPLVRIASVATFLGVWRAIYRKLKG